MYTHTGTDTLGLGIFYIGKEAYSMIKHIVLYTLKSDVNKDEAVEITKNALEPLVGVIPGLRHLEIRPAYQGGMDFALYSEFESKEALRDYANHPAHLEAKSHFWTFLESRCCADYEF